MDIQKECSARAKMGDFHVFAPSIKPNEWEYIASRWTRHSAHILAKRYIGARVFNSYGERVE